MQQLLSNNNDAYKPTSLEDDIKRQEYMDEFGYLNYALGVSPDNEDKAMVSWAASTIAEKFLGIKSYDGSFFNKSVPMEPRDFLTLMQRFHKERDPSLLYTKEYKEFNALKDKNPNDIDALYAYATEHGNQTVNNKIGTMASRAATFNRMIPEEIRELPEQEQAEIKAWEPIYDNREARQRILIINDLLLEKNLIYDVVPRLYSYDGLTSTSYADAQNEEVRQRLIEERDTIRAHLDSGYFEQEYPGRIERIKELKDLAEKHKTIREYGNQLDNENSWAVIAGVKAALGEEGRKILDIASHHLDDIKGHVGERFMDLAEKDPDEAGRLAIALHALQYQPDNNAFWDGIVGLGKGLYETPKGAVLAIRNAVERSMVNAEEYQKNREREAIYRRAFEAKMTDHSWLGDAVVGFFTTIPYMAYSAIPYAGLHVVALAAANDFEQMVADAGGDVSSPDFFYSKFAVGYAYAAVERLQKLKPKLGIKEKGLAMAYANMFKSYRSFAKVVLNQTGRLGSEIGEESLQEGITEGFVAWGLDEDIAAALARGMAQGAHASIGPFIPIVVIEGAGRRRMHRRGGMSTSDVANAVSRMNGIIEEQEGKMMDAAKVRQWGKEYGTMAMTWANAGGSLANRVAALEKTFGLSRENAVKADAALGEMYKAVKGDANALSDFFAGGKMHSAIELASKILGNAEIIDNEDGTQTLRGTLGADANGKIVSFTFRRDRFSVDPESKAQAPSIISALTKAELIPAGTTVEDWFNNEKYTPAQRAALVEQADLHTGGSFLLTAISEDLAGSEEIAIDENIIKAIARAKETKGSDLEGIITIDEDALPQTAFHEAMHGFLKVVEKLSPDLHKALKVAYPAVAANETLNEERLADNMRDYLTGKIKAVEFDKDLFDRIIDTAKSWLGIINSMKAEELRIKNAKTAQEHLFNQLLTGDFTGIPELDKMEDVKAARERKAKEEQRQRETENNEKKAKEEEATPAEQADNKFGGKIVEADNEMVDENGNLVKPEEQEQALREGRVIMTRAEYEKRKGKLVAPKLTDAEERERLHAMDDSFQGTDATGKSTITTPNGEMQVETQLAVVDASDLVTSDKPNYNPSYQNRLGRENSKQIEKIAQAPNPALLGASPTTDQGAPLVKGDTKEVIAGNGRILALARGDEEYHSTEAYNAFVRSVAEKYGLTIPEGVKHPRLVRIITSDLSEADYSKLAVLSNQSDKRIESTAGNMKSDGMLLNSNRSETQGTYSELISDDPDATLSNEKNLDFVWEVVRALNDASLLTADESNISVDGWKRIRNAVLGAIVTSHAHADSIIKTLAEDSTLNIDNILNAIRDEAHHLLKVKASAGKEVYDITPDIADALKDYIDFKHSGISDIDAFLAQQDMFANRPSLTASIMREFFAKKASQQQIADTLREYAKLAMLQDNDTPALFETEVAPRERLWELAVNKATGERYSIEAGVSSTPSAEEVAEARRQYDEVVARYTNPDGTKKPGWMKAPNGKPTKLTEAQWVQVRTPNFKKWFGDWEALVELVLPKATSTNDARSALEKLAGRKITNIVTGMTAVVNRNQREKILSREACRKSEANGFSMEEHNAAASIVDKLWKHAELLISHDDRNDDANIKQVHRFVAPISSNKGIVFAYITVKESTDHGERVYSLELETLKTLEGHMGKLVEAHPTSSVSEGIITKLKDKVNPQNISKVVDENGEPLVVYHATDDSFTEFKREKLGAFTEANSGNVDLAKVGFWFNNNDLSKKLFTENSIPVFLNIKNPSTTTFEDMYDGFRDEAADGYIVDDSELGGTSYVALESNQIKSATDNIGTFDGTNADTRFSIVSAARYNEELYNKALEMEKRGESREKIFDETGGMWKNKDGHWLVELPELTLNQIKELKDKVLQKIEGSDKDYYGITYGDILNYLLPNAKSKLGKLVDVYPRLSSVPIFFYKGDKTRGGYTGVTALNPSDNYKNNGLKEGQAVWIAVALGRKKLYQIRAIIVHELQHFIQGEEGWPSGTTDKVSAFTAAGETIRKIEYALNRGEINAKVVGLRSKPTTSKIKFAGKKVYPWETEQYIRDKMAQEVRGLRNSDRYSVTAAEDRAYLDAVRRGDMETAQRMVREAAARAMKNSKIRDEDGKLIKVYHGTQDMFYEFDTSKKGGKNGTAEGFGIYTSDNPEVTSAYGDRQIKMYANITKPATSTQKTISAASLAKLIKDTCKKQAQQMVDDGEYDSVKDALMDTWVSNYVYTYDIGMERAYREVANSILQANDNDMDIIQEVMAGMAIRDYSEAMEFYRDSLTPITGFDGFVTQWKNSNTGKKSNIILAFDSNQLKSADPVTYDDAGNVIPLSERFNPEKDDIRWSISGIYTGSAADYEKPSLHYVGTGEGSQVYGWGLYGSNVRGVAEKYAMPSGLEIRRHGKIVKPWDDKIANLIRANFTSRNPIESALKKAKEYKAKGYGWEQKDIESLENGDYEVGAPHSNLYEQTFFTNRAPGDESHLLVWYGNVSDPRNNFAEQKKWIRTQAKKEGVKLPRDIGGWGEDIYNTLANVLGSPQAASEFLARAGIDGVKYPVDSYGKTVKDGDEVGWNYVSFRDDNIRVDHKWVDGAQRWSVDSYSNQFNDELQQQVDGTLPKGHIYQLGMPSSILLSTGIPNLPIQLSSARLFEKSTDAAHPFDIENIGGLVIAIQSPIAIFSYGNKTKAQNLIVEISSNGKNFIVGISLNPQINGHTLSINSVRNVFPKDTAEWLHWIEQGKLLYADKEKVQAVIDQQRIDLADVDYLNLDKIETMLDSFTNPQVNNNISQSAPTVNGADVNSRSSIEANVANARLKSQQILDSIKGTVLGDAINKDFKETSTANLIGQTITSPEDLAALAQIYRNPSFETFRYFFVKNGEVVWQTGVTARLPSNAPVTVPASGRFVESDTMQEIMRMHDVLQPDTVYLLHNHPSGNVAASAPDIKATQVLAQFFVNEGINFGGHIIIDHNVFGMVDAFGNFIERPMSLGSVATYENSRMWHPQLLTAINSPADLAKFAADLQRLCEAPNGNVFTLIGANAKGKVVSIANIPTESFAGDTVEGVLKAFQLETGAADLLIAGDLPINAYAPEIANTLKTAFIGNVIKDFVSIFDTDGLRFETLLAAGLTRQPNANMPNAERVEDGSERYEIEGEASPAEVMGMLEAMQDKGGQTLPTLADVPHPRYQIEAWGNPYSYSKRSLVQAMATADLINGNLQAPERYRELAEKLGVRTKDDIDYVAEAKASFDQLKDTVRALQDKGLTAAQVATETAKLIDRKRFGDIASRIMSQSAKYGVDVGGAAMTAWQKIMKRLAAEAKGLDLAEMQMDTGADLLNTIIELMPEEFGGEPEKASADYDENGENENGYAEGEFVGPPDLQTWEEWQANEADRLSRYNRVIALVKASIEEKQKAIRAREARRAAQETAKTVSAGGDTTVDEHGNTVVDIDEDTAAGEEPISNLAIPREILESHRIDLNNADQFAAFIRAWVTDWLVRKNPSYNIVNVLNDPTNLAIYRKTIIAQLRNLADGLLDPALGKASIKAERMISDIPDDASPATLERRSSDILAYIQRNAVRQKRKTLIAELSKTIDKLAIKGKQFDALERDMNRKIRGEHEAYARYIKKIISFSENRVQKESEALTAIINGRTQQYDETAEEYGIAPSDLDSDIQIHIATEKLAALQQYGGLKNKSPAYIKAAARQLETWLDGERMKHEEKWSAFQLECDNTAKLIQDAVRATQAKYTGDEPNLAQRAVDDLITSVRQRLERMMLGSDDATRSEAIRRVMKLLNEGSQKLEVTKVKYRHQFEQAVKKAVEGTDITPRQLLKQLEELIPEELNDKLITDTQRNRMTWGQALQLYASLRQTATYGENIIINARQGQEEEIRNAATPEMLKLVDLLHGIYATRRDELSQVVAQVTGNPIWNPDPLYMPVKMATGREGLDTKTYAWSPLAKSLTPRVKNRLDFDLTANIIDIYASRTEETAQAIAFGVRGIALRSILARKDTLQAMSQTHGKFPTRRLIEQVTDTLTGGYTLDGARGGFMSALQKAGSFTTYAALSFNIVTAVKQMTSIPMWTAVLQGGYMELGRHLMNFDKQAAKELISADGFTARYGSSNFASMIADALNGEGNIVKRLAQAGMTAIQIGDFVPGIVVGTGVYKARLHALMVAQPNTPAEILKEQAATETWALIEECQQTSRMENTPHILRRWGVIGKQLTKFTTAPMQQVAHELHAYRMMVAAHKAGNEELAQQWRKKLIQIVVANHILLPSAMYAVATLFGLALGGEPPEEDELYGDILLQLIVGPYSSILFAGGIIEATIGGILRIGGLKPNVYDDNPFAAQQTLHRIIKKGMVTTGDIIEADWASARDNLLDMVSIANAPIRYTTKAVRNYTGYDSQKERQKRKREIRKTNTKKAKKTKKKDE